MTPRLLYVTHVAVGVYADSPDAAADAVAHALDDTRLLDVEDVDCWWVAEDQRGTFDGSDCDSAVFCKPGSQAAASDLLAYHGLVH